MLTSWPAGSALPKPRKRRKRPPSKAVRAERKVSLVTSQVMRKLTNGRVFDAAIPMRADASAIADLKCCAGCGGPIALSTEAAAILAIQRGGWVVCKQPHTTDGLAPGGIAKPCDVCSRFCPKCYDVADTHREPSVRRVGVGIPVAATADRDWNNCTSQQRGKLVGEYRPHILPGQADPDMRAGRKIASLVVRGLTDNRVTRK